MKYVCAEIMCATMNKKCLKGKKWSNREEIEKIRRRKLKEHANEKKNKPKEKKIVVSQKTYKISKNNWKNGRNWEET